MNFKTGDSSIKVLDSISLEIKRGESVALVGASGTGKSTLLQIAALLEKPTRGDVLINDIHSDSLNDDEKSEIRRNCLGFVYQSHNLLPEFSALENVIIPQLIKKITMTSAKEKALDLLEKVGLSHRLNHRPKQLSGGEQQRVAIARCLINDPLMIMADEPTGNLDPKTAESIFELFLHLSLDMKISVFMATHNLDLATRLDRVISL
ncbi:MAG: ABC transporter ATP-binding protein [Holosporales bacterium]|jgi:lipoprotein-releasing system ATP-binding protein|nr:ABC transporter ATP-binding protein [Holosporales bacterium]